MQVQQTSQKNAVRLLEELMMDELEYSMACGAWPMATVAQKCLQPAC